MRAKSVVHPYSWTHGALYANLPINFCWAHDGLDVTPSNTFLLKKNEHADAVLLLGQKVHNKLGQQQLWLKGLRSSALTMSTVQHSCTCNTLQALHYPGLYPCGCATLTCASKHKACSC